MSRRWFALGGGALTLGIILFGGFWLFFGGDEPPPVSLDDAVAAASEGSRGAEGNATSEAASAGTAAASATSGADDGSLAGAWVVDPSASFVGYRIQEELSSIGAATAVGRTSDVEGALEFDGDAITSVEVTANLQALTSNDDRRDRQLRRQALETNAFPEASFVLAEPIAIEGDPGSGEPIAATAVGDLTLHGVTNRVEVALEGRYVEGRVVVVGSTVIRLADYGIERPTAPLVLSVSEEASMEMQLIFVRG